MCVTTKKELYTYVQMCSDFLAGDALRSSQRYKALDETAIFGTACRHEFPYRFVNLKHGERYVPQIQQPYTLDPVLISWVYETVVYLYIHRLTYAVWLLDEIVDRQSDDIKLYLMYDVACNLVRHLKVKQI